MIYFSGLMSNTIATTHSTSRTCTCIASVSIHTIATVRGYRSIRIPTLCIRTVTQMPHLWGTILKCDVVIWTNLWHRSIPTAAASTVLRSKPIWHFRPVTSGSSTMPTSLKLYELHMIVRRRIGTQLSIS